MKLGIMTSANELQKVHAVPYEPEGYVFEENEPRVIFHLRPWTRTTQSIVEKRAKGKGMAVPSDGNPLKGIGSGDKKAEAFTRELAMYLVADWEGVVYGSDMQDDEGNIVARKGDPLPCEDANKVFLFEDIAVAVWVVEQAQKLVSQQLRDEVGNSESSSDGAAAQKS